MLKDQREAKGMTQEDLATRAKVSRSYIALLENGTKKNASVPVLKRLAKALGVAVAELIQ